MTAPLIADLFLLAISAIGRAEIHDGTLGTNSIIPVDIMIFFLTLAYIAISIDASGVIRWLAYRVLIWGDGIGDRLFFYLYAFFFGLGTFIGNDPIILSGTAFLAYMTRVADNIEHPRAWIHTQFTIANIASAILVSSNPTNLVLAGAFKIPFVDYTLNMVVPVIATAIVVFPFLLYVIFADPGLIPIKITMHKLPDELKEKKAINPNIPNARGVEDGNDESEKLRSLEEIMNPFLDTGGAVFGAIVMATTLITVLGLNAAAQKIGEKPVYYVTLPAAGIMLIWDLIFGWIHRRETRIISREGRREIDQANLARKRMDMARPSLPERNTDTIELSQTQSKGDYLAETTIQSLTPSTPENGQHTTTQLDAESGLDALLLKEPRSLVSMIEDAYLWCRETFPAVTAIFSHLPFALVPFALCMFILVEALVTKGWVQLFAIGWDHWVEKTGTVGAVGGMGFLSVIFCNASIHYHMVWFLEANGKSQFAGTNIGTTILLSRVIQAWLRIHLHDDNGPSVRDFWATVYAMALGVNFGAFSTAFSASLAGLLWRDILGRKHIPVRRGEFARVNLPIIAVAMVVGSTVLIGEVYIFRSGTTKYSAT